MSQPFNTPYNLPNNLPLQLTTFVGREKELAELKRLLNPGGPGGGPGYRLLTLVGPGGTGKTRLGLQVAAEMMDHYKDGVWLVELAGLGDESQVIPALAQTLSLLEKPGRPMLTTIIEYLKEQKVLLLLDNCEHLIEAAARMTNSLLVACPGLQIIVTSREALNINGETTFRVPSLGLPDPAKPLPVETLNDYEAVRLFIDRAVAANPNWNVTNQNAPALVQLCVRLDGIPLALELAAARLKAMTVEQINARLNDRFRLLTGGNRTALPRQQTLRALVDWSYELLSEGEKLLLQRLAVFAGGWNLNAAEQVCAGENLEDFEILDYLSQLVNKSLVVVEDHQGQEARYRFLETIRQYAREKLLASGQEASFQPRHLEYYMALCEEAAPKLTSGGEQALWLARLQTDYDNIRAALESSLQGPLSADEGLKLALSFWRFWEIRNYFTEGVEYFSRLLEKARASGLENSPHYAWGLMRAGVLEWRRGNFSTAQTLYEESLARLKAAGDETGVGATLNNLGNLFLSQGKIAEARPYMEESLQLARQTNDRLRSAITLSNLGAVASNQKDYESAGRFFRESLTIARELGDLQLIANTLNNVGYLSLVQGEYNIAQRYELESLEAFRQLGNQSAACAVLNNLGLIAQHREEYYQSRDYYLESLELARQLGNKKETVNCLVGLAAQAARQKQFKRSGRLLGGIKTLLETASLKLNQVEQSEQDEALDRLHRGMTEAEFNQEWEAGQLMSLDELGAFAVQVEVEAETITPLPASAIAPATLEPLRAGTVLGGIYRLEKPLGSGAMGEVWLAHHLLLNELRAIKIVLASLGENQAVVQRFIHGEARNALRLAPHPHIVRVYELGMHGQMPFIVMEYVEGDARGFNLREYMRAREKFSPAEVAGIVEQLAAALEVAHRLNIIHRDVKPANILLDGQKPGLHLKLSDFGLAKDIEVDVELTQSQVALGTPLYMAPEQFMGQAEPRSDQYSLGVIVYQLLAGQPPFKGTTQYIMMQHLTEPPPPLESILPSIPGGLAQVVMRTLAKIPEERYASVLEMAAAFRQALQDWNTTEDERTQVLELEEPTQILLPPTLPFKPPQE